MTLGAAATAANPEMYDSAGRAWSEWLEPASALRRAVPYHNPTSVPPGYWRETAHLRAAIRRAERQERDAA